MVSEDGGVDVAKLRALLSDHAPQTYMQRDQMKVAEVWDFARRALALAEKWRAEFAEAEARGTYIEESTYWRGDCADDLLSSASQ